MVLYLDTKFSFNFENSWNLANCILKAICNPFSAEMKIFFCIPWTVDDGKCSSTPVMIIPKCYKILARVFISHMVDSYRGEKMAQKDLKGINS